MHDEEHRWLIHLRSSLDRFREFEIGRPPAMSVDEYLQFLSAEGVVSEQTAQATRDLYHQARYGTAGLSDDEIERVERDLHAAVEAYARRDEADRRRIADRLHDRPAGPPPATPRNEPAKQFGVPATHPDPQVDDALWADAADLAEPPTRRRLWPTAAVCGVVWTIAVTTATYWNHHRIEDLFDRTRQRFSGGVAENGSDRHVRKLQERLHRAPAGPGRQQLLNELGMLHAQRGDDAKAIVAYCRAMSLDPEMPFAALFQSRGPRVPDCDPGVVNNLAWLLLTTDDPACHDPRQALPLAEYAYKLQPTPAAADTLAEAHYQNGHHARAVAYEREAVEKGPPNLDFYKQQLRKFEAARDAAAQTASTR